MTFDPTPSMYEADVDIPEIDLSDGRVSQLLGDIKRNSRNRRIAMFAPVVLAAAVLGAMVAAPPQHGGLALADAETPDPELPRVFGSNGVWRLAEPIEDAPAGDPGPADMIEAPTEPAAPSFALSPPDPEDLQSLPTSTSTPPTSTSGQSPEPAEPPLAAPSVVDASPSNAPGLDDPTALDWSAFSAVIRIEPAEPADSTTPVESTEPDAADAAAVDSPDATDVGQAGPPPAASEPAGETQEDLTPGDTTTPPDDTLSSELAVPAAQDEGDVTVAVEDPQSEQTQEQTEANPSTPTDAPTDSAGPALSAPAIIVPQSVLVYSAHVTVTVQVVDDDSSVIDWCNTRVDWGDGSVTRVAGADEAALCTASCEYESTSSAASEIAINQIIDFEHVYTETIDASPRVFVATGDGCSYNLAEFQLSPFTVVPLS